MSFETKRDVLSWYEKQSRTLTEEFHQTFLDSGQKRRITKTRIGLYDCHLFFGDEGLEWIDKNVLQRIQTLPGFAGLTKVSDKIGEIVAPKTLIV